MFLKLSERSLKIIKNAQKSNFRQLVAPWLPIQKNTKLEHLKIKDLARGLSVLKLCSYSQLIAHSQELFSLSQKIGGPSTWLVRNLFYNQFVGGETESELVTTVKNLQKVKLNLMLLPVFETDLESEHGEGLIFEENFKILAEQIRLCGKLQRSKGIFQLKPSAIMSPKTLEAVSTKILNYYLKEQVFRKNGPEFERTLAHIVESFYVSLESKCWRSIEFLNLTEEEIVSFLEGLSKSDLLVEIAKDSSVRVLVDSEFYDCREAISVLSLLLMLKHNKKTTLVGTTTQAYLKDSRGRLSSELKIISELFDSTWFSKLVRGAYLETEKNKRAICESWEETNESYNASLLSSLDYLREIGRGQLVLASHNEISLRIGAEWTKDQHNSHLSFAQIYGMADYLSLPLIECGYEVYKSTPYGPLHSVLPYLGRRAVENRFVLQGARAEREMLKSELRRRLGLKSL